MPHEGRRGDMIVGAIWGAALCGIVTFLLVLARGPGAGRLPLAAPLIAMGVGALAGVMLAVLGSKRLLGPFLLGAFIGAALPAVVLALLFCALFRNGLPFGAAPVEVYGLFAFALFTGCLVGALVGGAIGVAAARRRRRDAERS
jgi:hypothetical protein